MPTATLLPLDVWRAQFNYHPYHFWQLAGSGPVKVTGNCDTLVREYAYQDVNAVGRDDVRQAIADAETLVTQQLGYAPAPRPATFTVPWPRWHDASVPRIWPIDATGRWLGVQLPEGQIQAVGVRTRTLLDTPAVVLSDTNGDGVYDTFTATATVPAGTSPASVGVYFQASDRLDGAAVDEAWRIQPVSMVLSNVTLTITGRCWLVIKPVLYQGFAAASLDPQTAGNYVGAVEVYALGVDAGGTDVGTSQGVIVWETRPYIHGWWCLCTSCLTSAPASWWDPAAVGMAVARVGIRDAALGIVTPAQSTYDPTSQTWAETLPPFGREPDRAIVRCLAGAALGPDGTMDPQLARIVARLAAAELARRICACDQANAALYHWQFDLARTAGANDEQYGTTQEILNCPWGTRRGAVWAWRQVNRLRLVGGYLP